jgi:ferric-dicitrate binding protein FerR (iron transport regulator)
MKTEQALKELLQKYSEGTCIPEEEKLLQEWFSQIGQESPSSGLSAEDRQRMLSNFSRSPRFAAPAKTIKTWWPVAAAAVMVGIILFSLLTDNNKETVFVQMETGSGQIKQVVLPDGSVVWLNARTKLAYHPDFRAHREIRLSGEALFEVSPDAKHPFTVLTADSLQTTVLGTQFNIRSYERLRETQVTVVSGRVQVAQPNKVMGILNQNQVIRFDHEKRSYIKTAVNAAAITSWSTGEWEQKVHGLEELTLLLYNQYGITLVNRRQGLGTLSLDANFTKQQNVREIVTVFCLLADCRHRWKDSTTVELY